MKTLNFSNYNNTEDRSPAESRVDNTRPFDLYGRLYLTRLRFSKNSLPILAVRPWSKEFTEEEKTALLATIPESTTGLTPTHIAFFVGSNLGSSNPDNQESQILAKRDQRELSLTRHNDNSTALNQMSYCAAVHLFIPKPMKWETLPNGKQRLSQEPYLIYSWDEFISLLYVQITDRIYPAGYISKTLIDFHYHESLEINVKTKITFLDDQIYPNLHSLCGTEEFMKLFNLQTTDQCQLADTGYNYQRYFSNIGLISEGDIIPFYYANLDPIDDDATKKLTSEPVGSIVTYQNLGVTFPIDEPPELSESFQLKRKWRLSPDKANLFPVNTLLVCTPSINVPVQSIVINSSQSQGSIVPSNIPLLKLILLSSDSSGVDSDLIYVNDNDTASYIEVNESRIVRFIVKIYFLLKSNELVEAILPPEGNMFIQLGLIE